MAGSMNLLGITTTKGTQADDDRLKKAMTNMEKDKAL